MVYNNGWEEQNPDELNREIEKEELESETNLFDLIEVNLRINPKPSYQNYLFLCKMTDWCKTIHGSDSFCEKYIHEIQVAILKWMHTNETFHLHSVTNNERLHGVFAKHWFILRMREVEFCDRYPDTTVLLSRSYKLSEDQIRFEKQWINERYS